MDTTFSSRWSSGAAADVEDLDLVKYVRAGLIARAVDFRAVRSVLNEEKKLSMAASSQTLPERLMLQETPLSAIGF